MRVLVLVALVACGSKPGVVTPPANATAAPAGASTAPAARSVEDTAVAFMRAATAGDRPQALSLTLTFDEIAAISSKADREEWDGELKSVLDDFAREGKEQPFNITRAEVKDKQTVKADDKVKRDTDIALVQIFMKDDDGEHPAGPVWLFVRTDAGWRFSPKM
jgi:hypothetical protein